MFQQDTKNGIEIDSLRQIQKRNQDKKDTDSKKNDAVRASDGEVRIEM